MIVKFGEQLSGFAFYNYFGFLSCFGSRLFRPMSCLPGVVSPGPRVDSPGVWSRFIRSMKLFCPRVENKSIWESQESRQVQDFFLSMDGWMIELQTQTPKKIKSNQTKTGTKHHESDYSLLRKLPYWNIGPNLYQANQL